MEKLEIICKKEVCNWETMERKNVYYIEFEGRAIDIVTARHFIQSSVDNLAYEIKENNEKPSELRAKTIENFSRDIIQLNNAIMDLLKIQSEGGKNE